MQSFAMGACPFGVLFQPIVRRDHPIGHMVVVHMFHQRDPRLPPLKVRVGIAALGEGASESICVGTLGQVFVAMVHLRGVFFT
jgi:hypothetical protein